MTKKYRAIVLGCGKIGVQYEADKARPAPKSHAGALAADPRTELVALVDSNKTQLAVAKKLFPKARAYSSAAMALAKEKPDIVVIAASTKTHLPLVRLACRSGVKMIISEKPLCRNASEAAALAKVLRASPPVFVLNYQRRFFSLFERVRRDLAVKKIGRVQQVSCYYSNGLYNNAGHTIDSLLFLLGERITKVSGLENGNNSTHPEGDVNIDGILETKSGIRIALQSFDQRAYAIHHMRLFGTKGAIKLLDHGFTAEWSSIDGDAVIPAFVARRRERERMSFVNGALDEVIRCYEKKAKPVSGLKNGREVIAVLDALARSATNLGKEMSVRYSS